VIDRPAWWVYPFLMGLVLTGIHGYLGIHVLKRKVIFVDLAMAQIAALGAAYAILLGYEPGKDTTALYLFSLGFTLVGAAVISLTRMRHERVPHEAFIGIVYACASAVALLVLSKAKGEGEHIKHMLVGNLLLVPWSKVWTTGAIYAGIGAFHWVFREKFFAISEDPEAAEKRGISVRLWDFLFYASFGVVITSSVSIAGVLLVFSYLVVPAVVALLFADRTRIRIGIAWGVGTVASVLGMLISNRWDFDTGPSIVAAFAASLVAAGLIHYVTSSQRSGIAAGRLAAAAAVVALAVWGSTFLRKEDEHHHHQEDEFTRLVQALRSPELTLQMDALDHLADRKDPHAAGPIVELLKKTSSDLVIEHAAHALAKLGAAEAAPALLEIGSHDLDPSLRVELARAALDLRDPGGFPLLIDVLSKEPPAQTAREVRALVAEKSGTEMDLPALRAWWAERGPRLRWSNQTRRFE
jgi:zinc/manganese transport system permease protein